MRNYFVFICCVVLLNSCSVDRVIRYTYRDITITRVDSDAETKFYHGYCTGKDCSEESYIHVEYHGFNNMMGVYMVFKDSSKVEIIQGDGGYLELRGEITPKLTASRYSNDRLDNILEKYKKKNFLVVYLSNSIEYEKEKMGSIPELKIEY